MSTGSGAVAETSTRRRELDAWFERVPGRIIARAEQRRIERFLPDLFGYHIVQVGNLAGLDLLANSRILNRLVIDIDGGRDDGSYPVARASAQALPIESDSIDVLVLPHVLEFEPDPRDALREASRVLVGEGHLVVCCFNPWSFLGGWRLLLRRGDAMPWRGQFLGLNRMRDWLALLGFDLIDLGTCFFAPPVRNERVLHALRGLERAGSAATPFLAGAYVALARKRVSLARAVRPRWKPRRRLVPVGAAEPSTRGLARSRPGTAGGSAVDAGASVR